jgi:DNA-binding NarL/FixJ family response regulator
MVTMMDHENKIRLLIGEDNKLYQEGICRILRENHGFEILGDASNGIKLTDLVAKLEPDILLLNIFLPEFDGVDAIPVLKKQCPDTKILLLPGVSEDDQLIQAFKNGVKGYLPKNSSPADLIKAIQVVYNGEMWIERRHFAKFFSEGALNHSEPSQQKDENSFSLTSREQEILRLLIKGFSNKEIAKDLFISEKTVKTHLNNVFRKLNVTRRLEAILFAIKTGMV